MNATKDITICVSNVLIACYFCALLVIHFPLDKLRHFFQFHVIELHKGLADAQ